MVATGVFAAGRSSISLKNWKVDRATAVANAVSADSIFVSITPCRVIDTREVSFGAYGSPAFGQLETRSYNMTGTACPGIPVAVAYSLNVTIVNYDVSSGGWVTLYPSGVPRPFVSTVNFGNGVNAVANAAIVPADINGSIDLFAAGTTHVIVDINGYFLAAPPSGGVTSVTGGNSITATPTTGAVVVSVTDNSITNLQLASGSVATGNIQTGAVTTNEILNDTILPADLSDGAVTTTKIADANVTLPKISATGAVTGQAVTFDGTNIVWANTLNLSNSAVHTTDVSNICAINVGAGVGVNNATGLSLGGLNGAAASTAIVVVTANGGTTSPFTASFPPVAVAFVSAATVGAGNSTCSSNKWVIYTTNGSAMPAGIRFSVFGIR